MSRSDEQRLDDMREQCAVITRLARRGRDGFDTDEAIRLAMERSMEVVGEAANAVGGSTRARHPGVDWRRISRFRILLAHTTTTGSSRNRCGRSPSTRSHC